MQNVNTQIINIVEPLKIIEYTLLTLNNDTKQEKLYKKREVIIGSHPECDFVIEHPTVSRFHAKIEALKNGYKLTDLKSKNGTFV